MRWSIFLFVLVSACSLGAARIAQQGEGCEGSVLDDVHCAQGLGCDEHAAWTCQPDPSPYPSATSYPSYPSYPADAADAQASDAQASDAASPDAGPRDAASDVDGS